MSFLHVVFLYIIEGGGVLKVLLIQPPVRVDHDPVDIPAGAAILASIAINEGHQVAILDLNSSRPIPTRH